eukprot:scaffold1453_cov112-Isochrysis_galbana.AAC.19
MTSIEPPTETAMPSCTPSASVDTKASAHRPASGRETFQIARTRHGSKSEATAHSTMAASAAYGSHSNAGVSSVSTSSTTPACHSPCIGVPDGPVKLATSAERDSEAEAG